MAASALVTPSTAYDPHRSLIDHAALEPSVSRVGKSLIGDLLLCSILTAVPGVENQVTTINIVVPTRDYDGFSSPLGGSSDTGLPLAVDARQGQSLPVDEECALDHPRNLTDAHIPCRFLGSQTHETTLKRDTDSLVSPPWDG
jgi:hypothetical protein